MINGGFDFTYTDIPHMVKSERPVV
jgi:hypothetical protein